MKVAILLTFALNFGFSFPALQAQTIPSGTPGQDNPVIHATTREVVLDVVVRDKHQHAVTDLKPEEVEVFEDGVRQNVRIFRNIQGSEELRTEQVLKDVNRNPSPETGGMDAPPHPLNTMRQLNFISVVLAEIAPLNRDFSRRAVLEFLKSDNLPNTYLTVYRLNGALGVIQPYTTNKDKLAKAVDAATTGSGKSTDLGVNAAVLSSSLATVQAAAENVLANPATGAATAQAVENVLLNPLPGLSKDPLWAANAASQDVSVVLGNALLTQADMYKGLRFANSLSSGMDAIDSLQALVKSEENLPGRKVILYLADGLSFPVNRRDAVENLISYANRAGVSFYTIDTRGLNTEDPLAESLAAQRRTGAESSAQTVDPMHGHFEDDDVQLTAVANRQLAMRELAESTGGFAVQNTNEIALPMQHMMEDIRTHYELAYTPTSTLYDGHFRKIQVKVSRPRVTVQTRRGYFAVPDLNGEPLRPYEMLALNAMNATTPPAEIPYELAAMKFRPAQDRVEYEIAFEVPLAGLKAVPEGETGRARVQAALVAFIHDSSGAVVGKISRELAHEMASADAAPASADRILYAEPIELKAGHYVIDAAVADEDSGKVSVRRLSLFVAPGETLALSSLGLVRKFEPLAADANPAGPFDLQNGRITPALSESLTAGHPVALYFVVYPGKVAEAGPNLNLELLRDGREIASKPLKLGSPEADGSIPMFVQLSPGPGRYDVLVTAHQGTEVAQSSLSLRVQ